MPDLQTWIIFILVAVWGLSLAFRRRRADRNGCWSCRWCECDNDYQFHCRSKYVDKGKVRPAIDGAYCRGWEDDV